MTHALLEQTLGNLACLIPGATRVFHQHRLDFCCGGNTRLADAARQQGLDAEALALQLAALEGLGDTTDWRQVPAAELIEHILERFHDRHREQLPELIRLASRVEHVHGSKPDCPRGLAEHLFNMQQELENHMCKEEHVLFPMLERGVAADGLQGPITVMRHEHDQHGEALARLASLTNDITPPVNACNTWRALYRGLEELRDDLMQHIHLENNILFAARPVRTGAEVAP